MPVFLSLSHLCSMFLGLIPWKVISTTISLFHKARGYIESKDLIVKRARGYFFYITPPLPSIKKSTFFLCHNNNNGVVALDIKKRRENCS